MKGYLFSLTAAALLLLLKLFHKISDIYSHQFVVVKILRRNSVYLFNRYRAHIIIPLLQKIAPQIVPLHIGHNCGNVRYGGKPQII